MSQPLGGLVEGPDEEGIYTVMRSPDDAEDSPNYRCVLKTNSKERALKWVDE